MLLKSAILPLSYFKKSWVFGLALGVLLILFGFKLSTAHAENISIESTKNCDVNAVMWCGADSLSDIASKYNSGDGHNTATSIQNIYGYYGVSGSDIAGLSNGNLTVGAGSVNTSGNVLDSKGVVVATSAITGGRENIIGSTEETVNGTTFYKRPPSVSFLSSSLPAYIVMKNGQFDFAILASCGNPVKATPVPEASAPPQTVTIIKPKAAPSPKPTPAPNPPPPTSTPTTTSVCSGNTVNVNGSGVTAQGGNCSTNTTVVQTTPVPAPAPVATGACSSLDISVDQSNPLDVTATANSTVTNGATLENAVFNFGDGTITPPSTANSQTHVYAATNNYTITATLTYAASAQTVSPSTCQANLTMATPASSPVSPPVVTTAAVTTTTPTTTLVNTGPGDVVGIFGITTLIGTFGYHSFIKRRFY